MTRPAFVFDPDRCTACQACRLACDFANGGDRDLTWRRVFTLNPRRHPDLPVRHLSLACNHCDDPACLRACPAACYTRDPATGAVLLDGERCLGCRYCSWVCPYGAPRFQPTQGVMGKCTFCSERLINQRLPACTEVCPTGALTLGDHVPGTSQPRAPGLTPAGLGPALQVAPVYRTGPPPVTPVPTGAARSPWQPLPEPEIRPAAEWALILLTLVLPLLVAWFSAGLLVPGRAPLALPFLGLGAIALVLSVAHLGRPMRCWRALAGWRSSWLSLEILAAMSFLATAGATLLWPRAAGPLCGWLASGIGGAALLAVDGVYRAVPRQHRNGWHGAEAVLTAVLFLGLAADLSPVVLALAAVKLGLFLRRLGLRRPGVPLPWALVRVIMLVVACLPMLAWPVALLAAVAGEAVDRISFYSLLEPTRPEGLLAAVASSWSRPARS